ncbi:hypothetical protein PO883_15990 [Massilia sp. DJPM01]|uniref:hypothetical protein n=1 Tax=Massilia sp. DJPM01 TaxID=3024404 RepID=UPI00259EACD9|nr:hypothetical protein [Massilia sp. DJPM01]MDM5178701.1 hypothetical protein [Massilia sp. DJPM01]
MPIFRSALKMFLWSLLMVASAAACASEISIEWEIGNRFRMFDYISWHEAPHAGSSAALFEKMAPRKNENSASWLRRVLAAGGSPYGAERPGAWVEDDKALRPRYQDGFADAPPFFSIKARLVVAGSHPGMPADARCVWRMDGQVIATHACSGEIASDALPATGALLEVSTGDAVLARERLVPTVKIVLGLGDSYGAGEGAPDVPTTWHPALKDGDWLSLGRRDIDGFVKKAPVWLSQRCNRSFYSYQNMVALRIAADTPHSTVAFIHLACAGAEIVDGMLAPQRMVPGQGSQCDKRTTRDAVDPACDTPVSQLTAAVGALCKVGTQPLPDQDLDRIKEALLPLEHQRHQLAWMNELRACPAGQLRRPDLVLLSVGGNDIGFSGVIKWAILPSLHSDKFIPRLMQTRKVVSAVRRKGGVVCPSPGSPYCEEAEKTSAVERIGQLPLRFVALDTAFRKLLDADAGTVVLNTYPNPLQKVAGTMCGDKAKSNTRNAWYLMRIHIPEMAQQKHWQFNLTEGEAGIVNRDVIPRLTQTLARAASKLRWRVAAQERVMDGKGWCTGRYLDMLSPANIGQWQPYDDNVRMVRTGADSFLTQWPGNQDRSDGLLGAFHPNAQGYAAMADVVLYTLKK